LCETQTQLVALKKREARTLTGTQPAGRTGGLLKKINKRKRREKMCSTPVVIIGFLAGLSRLFSGSDPNPTEKHHLSS
jgi:isopentenyl phosphate kinase